MRRLAIVLAATGLGAFTAGWVGAQGARGAVLTGQDYAEIEQLMARYYQALDFEDLDMFESIWTEDAVYRIASRGLAVEGRDAIVRRTVERWAARPPEHERRHWRNNLVVTPTPEGAAARIYWISFEVSYSPPKPALSGHYDDVLVRTPLGWRFKERVLTIDESLRDGVFGHVW